MDFLSDDEMGEKYRICAEIHMNHSEWGILLKLLGRKVIWEIVLWGFFPACRIHTSMNKWANKQSRMRRVVLT